MSPLQAYFETSPSVSDIKKSASDQAFRDTLNSIIRSEMPSDKKQAAYCEMMRLVIRAIELGISTSNCPFFMMSDIFDASTLKDCEPFFKFVEDNVDTWKRDIFFDKGKNLLLRMSNDLLRRLSRSQNTIFCGRIQLFLASLFPLNDKSGLNLMSVFNLDNKTIYKVKSDSPKPSASSSSLKKEEGELDSTADGDTIMEELPEKESKNPAISEGIVDHVLYRKFWSLQDFFNRPAKLYDKAAWKVFASTLDAVLKVFDSYKLDDVKYSKERTPSSTTSTLKADTVSQACAPSPKAHAVEDIYFAKYLTNEKLLDLQLNDSTVRRNILTQLLVVFQYLNCSSKFKAAALITTEDQNTKIKELTEKVYNLLKETPPDGEQFAASVKHILNREEFWNQWKNEGCKSFDKPKINASVPIIKKPKKKPMGDDILEGDGTIKMGAAELTRLWNLEPDNLKACASEGRIFLPELESFLEEAVEQTDPDAQIEEEYKLINDQGWCWRALRLLARKSSVFWAPAPVATQKTEKKMSQSLEALIMRVGKEFAANKVKGGDDKAKEEGEIEEDAGAESANAVQTTNTEEDDEDELLKSKGEEKEADWQDREIDLPIIYRIAKRATSKSYRKLGHELNFREDDMATMEAENSNNTKLVCIKMLHTWLETEGDQATFRNLISALQGVSDFKPLVAMFKEGKEDPEEEEEEEKEVKREVKKERRSSGAASGEKRVKDEDEGEERVKKRKKSEKEGN